MEAQSGTIIEKFCYHFFTLQSTRYVHCLHWNDTQDALTNELDIKLVFDDPLVYAFGVWASTQFLLLLLLVVAAILFLLADIVTPDATVRRRDGERPEEMTFSKVI